MKHMRTRLILLMTGIVLVASILSIPISVIITRYIIIGNLPDPFIFGIAIKEILTATLIILLCIIIIGIASRRAVSPVVELSNATKQIAAGNFDNQ